MDIYKKGVKLYLFADGMILYLRYSMVSFGKTFKSNKYFRLSFVTQKSIGFLYVNNKVAEKKIGENITFRVV